MNRKNIALVFLIIFNFSSLTSNNFDTFSATTAIQVYKQTFGAIAVINAIALFSAGSCFLGLIKIFNPKASKITKKKNTTLSSQTFPPRTISKSKRPLFIRNEVLQGTSLFAIGALGLYGSWKLTNYL